MLTSEYLATLPDDFVTLWSEVESDITKDIVRQLAKSKTGELTDAAGWELQKLKEMGALDEQVIKEIAKGTKKSEAEIVNAINKAAAKGIGIDDAIYKSVGMNPAPVTESSAMIDILKAGYAKTNGLMKNMTRTTAITAQKAYYNAMDKAWVQMMSGAYSPITAIKNAIVDTAAKGYESIAYPSGHADRIEAAARRAILTGCNQTTAQLQLTRAEQMNSDLVEVSSHAGARPSHALWQGHVYSLSGKSGKYKNFYTVTGYGSGDGLCGWNCRHNFYPYFEGYSTPSFAQDPAREYKGRSNDDVYNESQAQRGIERDIRAEKQKIAAYDEAVKAADNEELANQLREELKKAELKLAANRQKMRTFIKITGRLRNYEREFTYGYNK